MRILVVEDDKKIADSVKRGLEMESFVVDVAYDGDTGLDFALGETYDVMILDIMLPGLTGIEITKQIREEDISTPILFLTARTSVDDRVNGLNIGADDYLIKPFSFDELLARVRALSRRKQNYQGALLQCGNLILDSTSGIVTRNSQQISLSKKEYTLLQYLMMNMNQTLSKDDIIQHVWDYESDVLPNTVEVYIRYLRDKVDRAFPKEEPVIHTVRGFGYMVQCKGDNE